MFLVMRLGQRVSATVVDPFGKARNILHATLLRTVAVHAAIAVAAGLVWWQRGQAYYGGVQAASDILGLLFFILLFPSMRALFRALFTFPNEYRMLLKVRQGGGHEKV